MNSIASFFRIAELVPPPNPPVRAYGDWKRFVSANGFWPPEDFRMLIREYGAGTFADWLQIIEPFNPSWTFLDRADAECRTLRARQQKAPHAHPNWPLWPVEGGFLPWATTIDGDHVGWRTTGKPETWTTLFWCRGGTGSTEYRVGAVDFLLGLVERTLGDPNLDADRMNPFLVSGCAPFAPATT